jgi:outer membrane protein insertion porin family
MNGLGLTSRARLLRIACLAAALGAALAPARALAFGEPITDVRILDNQRTEEATVRSIAGVTNGDMLEADTLDKVRERLNTSGLFADVNVWWEPNAEGVRVNISVKDKFPWAPVPTASFSANNKSFGLLFVHGNLFRRGKQLLVGGRIATVDSGAVIGYRDPALFGTWIYWGVSTWIQRQVVPEYDNSGDVGHPTLLRENHLFGYGVEPTLGIAWLRRVKTQVAWRLEKFKDEGSFIPDMNGVETTHATKGGVVGVLRSALTFDFRAREFAVMRGAALYMGLDLGDPQFRSDFNYWRAGVSWEHGIRFFKQHNLVYYAGANTGENLPFWSENTAGGQNLRGYLFQQFRGDTAVFGNVEYHFPLFSVGSLDFRALVFYDAAAVWYRADPTAGSGLMANVATGQSYYQRDTPDGRTLPGSVQQGIHLDSIHEDVGGGLRFFLRSVAVPLVGFDAGYGLEARNWRFILIVGA